EVVRRLRDALDDVDDVLDEPLDLRVRAVRQRTVRDDALDCVRVCRAHKPDAVPGEELDIVGATAQEARILIRAGDPDAPALLVGEQEYVLVVAQVVTVTDRR